MRFPLILLSLALLALFVGWQLAELAAKRRPRRMAGAPQGGPQPLGQRLEAVFRDALGFYVPFAAIALQMLNYGKPGLLPQYAGWAVAGLQVLRGLAVGLEMPRSKVVLGLLALACIAYLWVLQLPFFDPLPA